MAAWYNHIFLRCCCCFRYQPLGILNVISFLSYYSIIRPCLNIFRNCNFCSSKFVCILKFSNLYCRLLKQPNNLQQLQTVNVSYCFKSPSNNIIMQGKHIKYFLIKITFEIILSSLCILFGHPKKHNLVGRAID